jgi:hypothetical protein
VRAVGNAPLLKQEYFKVSSNQKFAAVGTFLKKALGLGDIDTLVTI